MLYVLARVPWLHVPCLREGVGDEWTGLLADVGGGGGGCGAHVLGIVVWGLKGSLAAQQAANALLTVLHHDVEVVVDNEVLVNSHRALLVLSLQLDSLVDLGHHRLPVIDAHLLEVYELFDEEQRL